MIARFRRLGRERWLQLVLGSAISVLALYLALRKISLQDVMQVFSRANWVYLAFALIAWAIHNLAKAARWGLLLAPVQTENRPGVPLRDLFFSLMAGQMLNLVYPGRVGDISRILVIGGRGPGKAATAGTLVLEKAVDTICYAILMAILSLLIAIPGWLVGALLWLVGMLAGFWLFLFLFGREQPWPESLVTWLDRRQMSWLPARRIEGLLLSFRAGVSGFAGLRAWQPFARLSLWSATAWGMSLLINWLVAISVGLKFDTLSSTLAAQILVLIGLQAGIAIPSLPGRVGVFEYICVLTLGVFGIEPSAAFGYGVLLHVVVMLPTLLMGWAALVILGLDRKLVIDEHAEV